MNTAIIQASSRRDGETSKVVNELVDLSGWDCIDLLDYEISHFDYNHDNLQDDFIPLMEKITEKYEVLIFATPVYWYSMSGHLKVFFDRFTDLLSIEKDTGRKLRNKYMAVITSSNGGNLGEDFWHPFKATADYLGMHYIGNVHTYQDRDNSHEIAEFKKMIEENTGS